MDKQFINNKIKEYELFVENTLKQDLKDVEKNLSNKVNQYKEWEEVKNVIKTLKEFKDKDCDMNVRVSLGNGVHAHGEINDYERTYIDIGLGHFLLMDYEEANKYSEIRLKSLKRDIDHYRQLAVHIKVNIKMVLLALNELQSNQINV